MWTSAKVEPLALGVELDLLPFGDGVDQLELERLALLGEQLLRRLPVHDLATEGPVARDDLAHLGLDNRQVVRREGLVTGKVVIEAVLDDRADGDLRAGIELLHRFRHDMGGVVTDECQRLGIIAGEDADGRIGFDWLGEIAELAVERNCHRLLGKRLGDLLRHLASRDAGLEIAFGTVGECE